MLLRLKTVRELLKVNVPWPGKWVKSRDPGGRIISLQYIDGVKNITRWYINEDMLKFCGKEIFVRSLEGFDYDLQSGKWNWHSSWFVSEVDKRFEELFTI
jgi:hypothetical protein